MSEDWFSVIETGDTLQSAYMRLEPGTASGPMGNEHAESEQILYVVRGTVVAEVGGRTWVMQPGDSVVVRRNVPHRFRNEGSEAAVTFNVYSPPAY
jgi:mannose-6-phosphate isomerase-like protein (cupin superfamily)